MDMQMKVGLMQYLNRQQHYNIFLICITARFKLSLLKSYVKRHGKLSVEETVKIGLQISEILKYLHKQSVPVIHGDIKPENIMVGPDKIQLIDFGGSYLMYSRREILR